jgi:hypothetical protein
MTEHKLKLYGKPKLSKFEESVANDPKRITNYNAFAANINYLKLKKKNINLSPSLGYRRPIQKINSSLTGGNKRSRSTLK